MSNRPFSHEFSPQDYDLQRTRSSRFNERFQHARRSLTGRDESGFRTETQPQPRTEMNYWSAIVQAQLPAVIENFQVVTAQWSREERAALQATLHEAAAQSEQRIPGRVESTFNAVIDYIIERLAAFIPKEKIATVIPLILSIAIPLAGLGMETGTAAAQSPDNIEQATTTTVDTNEQAVGTSMLLEVNRIAASILKNPGGEPVVVPPKGSLLTSTGEKDTTNTWIKVKTADGKEGWIRIANVTEVKQQTLVPTLEGTTTTTNTVETATLQNFYTPDQDQNVRSAASVTGTIVGSIKTGVAIQFYDKVLVKSSENGKEYHDLWFRIGQDAWVAFVYHGRQLGTTSQVDTENLPVGGGAEGLNIPVLIDDYNKVAATLGLSETVGIMQVGDGSLQYLNADNEVIAVARPVMNAQPGMAVAELFSTDANGNPDKKLGEDMGDDTGWKVVTEAEQGAEVAETITMEAKLLEIMEKNSDVFPESLLAEVKKLEFDENRGGWIVDENHVYIPFKTSNFGKDASIDEGTVWMPENNFVIDPETGSKIYFGVGEGSHIDELRWQQTEAKAAEYTRIFAEALGLPAGFKLRIVFVKDITGRYEGEHLRPDSRRDIESMLVQIDTETNAQVILKKNSKGEVIDAIVLISRSEKFIKSNGRPPEMFAQAIGWDISTEAFLSIDNVVNDRGPRSKYDALGIARAFGNELKKLYDYDSAGKIIPGQTPLFGGKPNLK